MGTPGVFGFVSGMFGGIALYLITIRHPGVLEQPPRWARKFGMFAAAVLFVATVAVLLFGPTSLPGSMFRAGYDRVIDLPFFQLLVGLTFGAIASEWLRYILLPVQLRTSELLLAHTRWGFVLLVLLAAGALYPILLGLNLIGANISTPAGSVSLTAASGRQSIHVSLSLRQTGGAETSHLSGIKPIALVGSELNYLDRDEKYDEFFLTDWASKRNMEVNEFEISINLNNARYSVHGLLDKSFATLATCVKAHFAAFKSLTLLDDRLTGDIVVYIGLLKSNNNRATLDQESSTKLFQVLKKSAATLGRDLDLLSSGEKSDCTKKAAELPEVATTEIDIVLPYVALGLAHLQGSIGSVDAAAATVAHWIDTQFGKDAQATVDQCNKDPTSRCRVGIRASAKSTVLLPIWYRIRAQFDLVFFLSHGTALKVTTLQIGEMVRSLEDLFSQQQSIHSASHWSSKCPDRKFEPAGRQTAEGRLMITYLTLVDNLVYYSTKLDPALSDQEMAISGLRLLAYAKANTEFNLVCLAAALVGTGGLSYDDVDYYSGSFLTQYGTLLARLASDDSTDIDESVRLGLAKDARNALNQAIHYLAKDASDARAEANSEPLEDQISFYDEAQESIDQAQQVLGDLKRSQ